MVQLGMALGALYVAFLTVWFSGTRFPHALGNRP
jgi:hypothetical protein